MDFENRPNMKRTRIGGGYMVVGYGSGGGIWQRWWYMDTDWWWYMDTDRWWYVAIAMKMLWRRRDNL